MNTHLSRLVSISILGLGIGVSCAHAEGLYLGGSLGSTNFPGSINGITTNGAEAGGKVFGGYQFTPNFALEGGAAEFGRQSNSTGRVSAHGLFLDAVGIAPLNDKWSLLGRLGVTRVDFNTTSGNSNGNGIKVGLGAQYDLTNRIAVRAEWERYRPSVFGQKPDLDLYSVGLRVGF